MLHPALGPLIHDAPDGMFTQAADEYVTKILAHMNAPADEPDPLKDREETRKTGTA